MIHLIYVIVRVEQNIFTTTDHIWVRSFVFDFGTLSSYNYSLSFRPVTCIMFYVYHCTPGWIVLRVSLYPPPVWLCYVYHCTSGRILMCCFTCIIVPPGGLFYVYHCTPGWILMCCQPLVFSFFIHFFFFSEEKTRKKSKDIDTDMNNDVSKQPWFDETLSQEEQIRLWNSQPSSVPTKRDVVKESQQWNPDLYWGRVDYKEDDGNWTKDPYEFWGQKDPSPPAFIVWSVGKSRNRNNWARTTLQNLRHILRKIVYFTRTVVQKKKTKEWYNILLFLYIHMYIWNFFCLHVISYIYVFS